jgi:carbamoyltransferase
LKRKYKLNYLCIAGGVGLNCSLNGRIHDSKFFRKIFVQPASGDAGLSYGTAIVSFLKNSNRKTNFKSRNFYLGSSFSTNEIKKSLVKYRNKINFIKKNNIFFETAKILKNGSVVAWFQDATEFGPRALGNRSILCKPYPIAIKDHINKYVKFRESFRPFAPAVLKEYSKKFFYLNQSSDHMLIATKVKKSMKKKIEATVHIDNSCRVQTVDRQVNRKFYNLINNFKKLTNIPVLLNTSFNVKGQPIVNSPDDAILCFLKYRIDYLIINNFLIKKKIKN